MLPKKFWGKRIFNLNDTREWFDVSLENGEVTTYSKILHGQIRPSLTILYKSWGTKADVLKDILNEDV